MKCFIKDINCYLPGEAIPDPKLEQQVSIAGKPMAPGMLHRAMGSHTRHHAKPEEQVSDLAVSAARPLLAKYDRPVDLLIFASASADLIEPATCNIVQHKLGLHCAAFDVKNACNSVLSALEVGCSMLQTSQINNVLIVSGEKPSDSITYEVCSMEKAREHFAAYSFGDAGLALLLEKTGEEKGFIYQKSKTFGEHWPLCTIMGGGSMFPRDASKLAFTGQTYQLKEVFHDLTKPFVTNCVEEAGLHLSQMDYICTHQVSAGMYAEIAAHLEVPLDRFVPLFEEYGNTASISVPLAYHHLVKQKGCKPGSYVMLLGLAAGVNISVQILKL